MPFQLTDLSGLFQLTHLSGLFQLTDLSGLFQLTDLSGLFQLIDLSGLFQLTDLSGLFQLTDLSGLFQLTDLSGPFQLTDLSGPFQLTDLSGPFQLTDLSGLFQLTDLSGPFQLTDLSGLFQFTEANAGTLKANNSATARTTETILRRFFCIGLLPFTEWIFGLIMDRAQQKRCEGKAFQTLCLRPILGRCQQMGAQNLSWRGSAPGNRYELWSDGEGVGIEGATEVLILTRTLS